MSKVFVGNLDYATTRQNLEALFAPHGTIVELVLPVDRATGQPRGFAFVTLDSEAEASEAIQRLDGTELLGRNLRVSPATERSESRGERGGFRSPQRFGGGRPGGGGRPKGSRRGVRGRKRSL